MIEWLMPWPQRAPPDHIRIVVALALGILDVIAIGLSRRPALRVIHRRGALIEPHRPWYRLQRAPAYAPYGRLTLAGVPIAPADELKHFKFIGTTGTGKSTAIGELLASALRRGDRAVVSDPDGAYT